MAVLAAFNNDGIHLGNIDPAPKIDPDSQLPPNFAWTDDLLGDKGSQLFVCETALLAKVCPKGSHKQAKSNKNGGEGNYHDHLPDCLRHLLPS